MKIEKSWILAIAVLVVAISLPTHGALAYGDETQFQFVITLAPAPAASSTAEDGSRISFTGTGTFKPEDPEEVTGGGTWETRDNSGNVTGGGSWLATRLVKFDLAPGAVADPAIRAGLAFLQITYSDGAKGILAASCHLPGSPSSVAEGIIASKDFTLYGGHVHAGPTFFRVLAENED